MHKLTLPERQEEQDILFGAINRFIGYFTRQTVPHTTNNTANEYPFVAMDTRQAYEQIRLARHFLQNNQPQSAHYSFLDIGCGIGNILLLAELMDFDVFGIEKDEASLEIAKNLMGEPSVSEEDIWQFDRVDHYDVIYYFRPFCEKTLQIKFEQHIEDKIKPGALLIANRKMNSSIDTDPKFSRLSPEWPVWQKTTG